ncbi:phosphotransferase [Ornithinimicrobium pekingense]|uniref:Aminoglycoside phosphotransferase domain-containing protein n=1 Tax=Ornithinimicrobium pekingense TaxID=384677 RepID=A0ABQ2F610_9MICO|nr:phosphotransferase [Ornithinimicrobium pekingense]GGK65508.1 hypothetical protein GCM10011509_12210 [Ornithinimicrobium pekingense]
MRTDLALAALASAAVPGMKPVAVAALGPADDERGRELQTALVEDGTGRRWVVRCPLTPVAGARLRRNDELVRQLPRHVPFKVPAAAGYAPVGKDGSAAVYPHVEGSPLDLRRLPAGPGLASAVGRALAAVHNIPRAVFEEQDVPVFDASGARQRAIAEVDRAAETGRVPTGLLARWEEAFEAAPLWQFATTPVHGAFGGSSVVVAFTDEDDAATGRVVAVTDWDEAMVGDPAVDLAELWSQSSRQAWEAVLDSYTLARAHRPDPYLHARARLVAELGSLRGLAHAVSEGDEEGARRCVEALRRMDRLTEADDSLVPVTARPSGARPAAHPEQVAHQQAQGEDEPGEADPTAEVPPLTAQEAPGPVEVEDRDDDATVQIEAPVPDGSPAPAVTGPPYDADADADVHDDADADAEADADVVAHPAPEGDGGGEIEQVAPTGAPPQDGLVPDADTTGAAASPTPARVVDAAAPTGPDDVGPAQGADGEHLVEEDRAAAAGTARPADQDVEQLPDEERLHELYGMPTPDRGTDGR